MTRCHRVSRCISGQRECVREAERIDDPLLEDVVPDAAAKNLDDTSCKDVRGVRVREAVLEWMNLTEVTQALDVASTTSSPRPLSMNRSPSIRCDGSEVREP